MKSRRKKEHQILQDPQIDLRLSIALIGSRPKARLHAARCPRERFGLCVAEVGVYEQAHAQLHHLAIDEQLGHQHLLRQVHRREGAEVLGKSIHADTVIAPPPKDANCCQLLFACDPTRVDDPTLDRTKCPGLRRL